MSVMQLFDLTGKVALITGGTKGLGLQMAQALGEQGARIFMNARKADEVQQVVAELKARGIEADGIACDLSKPEGNPITTLVDAAEARFGTIDILINNAGTTWGEPAAEHSYAGWQKVMYLNVDACFLLAQEVARRFMIPRRSGKIINIASIAGLKGNGPNTGVHTAAYNTSKAAAINLTRALAGEWGAYNINVNAICPGYFPTKLAKGLDHVAESIIQGTPMGRVGGEDDIKGVALLLASEASRHISGQAIAVDGGYSAV
ncbi:SDR family oxidoreductase [Halopseudomonas formosensis]|uniref:Gluconate 5-dehydrogenase n=1 Tax=Halopseudomonas formosensis TaxID=1002526 RepID=A0A1I5ZWM5_9GAMM|nr:SDR family oxidoreductase [Halopseudomonas formosensis]MDX9687087.1 SDR family oxidoreductase [Halopseudomonas formosensis]MDY3197005.1 SDR family oxidoreductase [Pseudomonadaceae bacterium]SFQ60876.1 gluconate 5-dehydrogenase [Halopseudomonas formosensis]